MKKKNSSKERAVSPVPSGPSPLDFGKVAVLLGGRSAEREISLRSGNMVLGALTRKNVNAHAFDPQEQGLEQRCKRAIVIGRCFFSCRL